jgi:hypothetical protein
MPIFGDEMVGRDLIKEFAKVDKHAHGLAGLRRTKLVSFIVSMARLSCWNQTEAVNL